MTVLIASIEDPTLQIRLEGSLPQYDHSTQEFRLNLAMGDDWLQHISHIPSPAPLIVRTEGSTAFVVFDKRHDAEGFEDWLRHARGEQDQGFRTMRG